MAQLGFIFLTTLFCGAGIRTHVTSVRRVAPDWGLWRTLNWRSYSAAADNKKVNIPFNKIKCFNSKIQKNEKQKSVAPKKTEKPKSNSTETENWPSIRFFGDSGFFSSHFFRSPDFFSTELDQVSLDTEQQVTTPLNLLLLSRLNFYGYEQNSLASYRGTF